MTDLHPSDGRKETKNRLTTPSADERRRNNPIPALRSVNLCSLHEGHLKLAIKLKLSSSVSQKIRF